MNRFLAVVILPSLLAAGASAQTPPPAPVAPKSAVAASCEGCGVVRSVKRVEKSQPITAQERKSTAGLVASVPLGGGKPSVGSVTDVRNEKKPPTVTYEVVVRLDDGRFQLVTQDEAGNLREGDKVRLDRGKVVLREK
ncbi:MAG: hypothetical protein NDI88_11455 [Lysobacter sp.]|nr:hypothetical protein [Lysobacter sp.]